MSTPRHQGITCSKSGLLFKKFYLPKICLKNFVRIKFCRTFALGKRENSPFPRRNAFSNQLINLLLKGKNTLLTNQKKPAVIAGFFCCAPFRGTGVKLMGGVWGSHLIPGSDPCRHARPRSAISRARICPSWCSGPGIPSSRARKRPSWCSECTLIPGLDLPVMADPDRRHGRPRSAISHPGRGRRAISCPVYLENPCFSTLTCLVLSRLPHLTVNLDAAASKKGQKCRLSGHAQRRNRQKTPKVPAVRLWFGGDIRIRRSARDSATPRKALGAVQEPVPAVTPRLPAGKRRALLKNLHPTSGANGNVRHMPNGSKVGTYLFGGRVPGLRPRKKNTVRWVRDRWHLCQ